MSDAVTRKNTAIGCGTIVGVLALVPVGLWIWGAQALKADDAKLDRLVTEDYAQTFLATVGDVGITSITRDGSLLFVDLDNTVSADEYEMIARGWACKFSRDKQALIGTSHVCAIVRVGGAPVCHASGAFGRCTEYAPGAPR